MNFIQAALAGLLLGVAVVVLWSSLLVSWAEMVPVTEG